MISRRQYPVTTLLMRAAVLTCGMQQWEFWLGARVQIYLIFAGFFVLANLIIPKAAFEDVRLPREQKYFSLFLIAILCLQMLSLLFVDLSLPRAFELYLKDLCYYLGCTLFFISASRYIVRITDRERNTLLKCYLVGAIASSLFCIAEAYSVLSRDFDLARALFTSISVYGPQRDPAQIHLMHTWNDFPWGRFVQVNGFAGVNPQAAYSASAVAFLVFLRPFRPRFLNPFLATICCAGTVLTMSRSGFAILSISVVTYLLISPVSLRTKAVRLVPFAIPVLLVVCLYPTETASIAGARLNQYSIDTLGGRTEIWQGAWSSISSKPFGNGIGQFWPLSGDYDILETNRTDPHSYWLQVILYTGWEGLALVLCFLIWLLVVSLKLRTELSCVLASILAACMVANFLNVVLNDFFMNLFITLFFSVAILSRLHPPRMPTALHSPEAFAR